MSLIVTEVVADEYWYFTKSKPAQSAFPPEFRYAGPVKCSESPLEPMSKVAQKLFNPEFADGSFVGGFASKEAADESLLNELKRIKFTNPNTKFIPSDVQC